MVSEEMKQDPLSSKDRVRIAAFVEASSGIQCPASKHSLVEGRLRKRQRKLGIPSLKEYVHHVLDTVEGAAEKIHLLDALTTNKTDFYREIDHFRFLRSWIARDLDQRKLSSSDQPLRSWSAGCSTGEEPYTLAIELEELKRRYPHWHYSILATDISLSCLRTAKAAIYPHDRIEPIPLQQRKRYLLRSRNPQNDRVRMAPELRRNITFNIFNLLQDNYRALGSFDVIFCRNVMIYFDLRDREYIIQQFARSLKAGGLLFIGHSENLVGDPAEFMRVSPTVYQRTSGLEN